MLIFLDGVGQLMMLIIKSLYLAERVIEGLHLLYAILNATAMKDCLMSNPALD